MHSLEELEAIFLIDEPEVEPSEPLPNESAPVDQSQDRPGAYQRRLASLLGARGGRYERCLSGEHDYPSDSESALAVVDAMVARHFSDVEIWQTLEGSDLLRRRFEKKGEKHA